MANVNSSELNGLIAAVSKKMGVSQEKLRQDLQSGKFDSALNGMSKSDADMFSRIISNPQLLEKFMNTPQAAALYKKLMK